MTNYFAEKKNRKTLAAAVAILLATGAFPLLFENCSASPNASNPITVAQVAGTAPFAYSMSVDTLAYMSCDGETEGDYTEGQLWTFKAAALGSDAGIQITPGFWSVASQLNSVSEMVQAVEGSTSNGAYPQLAIRIPKGVDGSTYGMQGFFVGTQQGTSEGLFAGVTPIDSNSNLQNLFEEGEYAYLSEAPSATGTPSPLAAYVDFTTAPNETDANIVRQYVSAGGGYLALAFTNQTWDSQGGALPSGSQNLYGLGYQFKFEAGTALNSNTVISSGTTRVVSGVTEYNLSNFSNDGMTWNCNVHLMIVRPGNDANTYCPVNTATAPPTSTIMAMLPSWRVNWALNCAVPETDGVCYGVTSPDVAINYSGPTCNSAVDNCPHYITICSRVP